MSIARRIAELYEIKMNAVLDRAADPGEMVDYTYVQLQELLAEVRRGAAGIAASREQAQSRASGLRQAADRLGEQAEQAVQAGRDDLARQALARRAALLAQASRLREQQDALRAEEQKMADAGRRLREKIEAFGTQREAIKAAYTVARAQAAIAEAFAGISEEVTDADAAARQAENEQADLEARARGLDDLLTPPLSDEQLQAQLDQISTRAQVDEELARLSERLAAGDAQGHRAVPHTADLRIEAWAATREECLAEAARGLVDSFAVVAAARPRRTAERRFIAGADEDLLVAVIDEVIYRLDADGEIPVTVDVRPARAAGWCCPCSWPTRARRRSPGRRRRRRRCTPLPPERALERHLRAGLGGQLGQAAGRLLLPAPCPMAWSTTAPHASIARLGGGEWLPRPAASGPWPPPARRKADKGIMPPEVFPLRRAHAGVHDLRPDPADAVGVRARHRRQLRAQRAVPTRPTSCRSEDLLWSLVDIAAKGGNLLLNVGPRGADATIADAQLRRLDWLGEFTAESADAVVASSAMGASGRSGRCHRGAPTHRSRLDGLPPSCWAAPRTWRLSGGNGWDSDRHARHRSDPP